MNTNAKRIGFTSLACLIVGFLLGFIPEYIAKSHVEHSVIALASQGETTQKSLHHTERQLHLNEFALQAAVVSADANSSNYADASASASALFTGMRDYVDHASDDQLKQPIEDVLLMRDTIISGLAKADPGVRPALNEIFLKLNELSSMVKS